jgi:PBP1b-binding outer membrane lipoprotein LpoB
MRKTILMSLVLVLMLSGCAQLKNATSSGSSTPETRPSPRYLDFADILIPGELERVAKECNITNGFGKLVVSGRVEMESLSQFFITSMNSEGWVSLNQYKFQGSVKLFFKKPDRFASVLIEENPLATRVELWVVPQEKI